MRTTAKPFALIEGGVLPYMIRPRGWKGWAQFAFWIAAAMPLVLWVSCHLKTAGDGSELAAGLFLFGIGAVVWLFAGIWWALPRAELVRMVEVRRRQQYARRAQARQAAREQQIG